MSRSRNVLKPVFQNESGEDSNRDSQPGYSDRKRMLSVTPSPGNGRKKAKTNHTADDSGNPGPPTEYISLSEATSRNLENIEDDFEEDDELKILVTGGFNFGHIENDRSQFKNNGKVVDEIGQIAFQVRIKSKWTAQKRKTGRSENCESGPRKWLSWTVQPWLSALAQKKDPGRPVIDHLRWFKAVHFSIDFHNPIFSGKSRYDPFNR